MTVGRLLNEASSLELTKWQVFFAVSDEREQEERRRREEDRRLIGDEA